jgi:SNF2 family DNA or RNA helicase
VKYTPRPYQRIATEFIVENQRCNLWLPMGMGKTASVLSALDMLWLAGSKLHPALVIAPKRVAQTTWPDEVSKWDDFRNLKVSPILGTPAQRKAALQRKADLYTINYENIPWLVEQCGKDWPFQIVIADESTRLKSFRLRHGGQRAAALGKVAKMTGRWINLTGTPAPNGLKDLWGQNWFVDSGHRLGRSYTAFISRWFDENPYTYEVSPKLAADEEILERLADVTVSLRVEDWLDLGELIHTEVPVELPPKARKLYDEMERELFIELGDEGIEAATAAARAGKCLQLASGAVYDEDKNWHDVHDAKIEALRDIVAEAAGAPVLVSYWFKFDRAKILKAIPSARVLESEKDIRDWNAGKIPVMLAHPASAGHGLNLQDGGNIIVYYSQTWDLELRQQILERIGPTRQKQAGHDRPVFVYDLVARSTMDEEALARVAGKMTVQEALMLARRRRA